MFCSKCGKLLKPDAAFCNHCGTPVEKDDFVPEIPVDESIALAEKLKAKYAEVEKLTHEVADKEREIARPLNLNYRTYSFFRFYWKFLVFAAVAFFVLDIITLIVASSGSAISNGAAGTMLFLLFAIPIGILIAGIFIAGKRMTDENYAISMGNERVKQQRKKLEDETTELKETLNLRKRDLVQYNDTVPEGFRKSSSMAQVKSLLISGKASSFPEAFSLLRQ